MRQITVAFLLLAYLLFATSAHALQCYEIVPDDAFEAASRVVIVELKSVQSVADSKTRFELSFDVLTSLKGPSSKRIEQTLEKTPWVDPNHFSVGTRYLWFLEVGQVEIGLCEKILVLEGRAAQWYAQWKEKNAK